MNQLVLNDLSESELVLAGIDEAGRGALAGPVVVACVVLSYQNPFEKLNDSKQLNEKNRERLYEEIINDAKAFSIIEVDHRHIDLNNILQSTLMGMYRSFMELGIEPTKSLIDGNTIPKGMPRAQAVVKGDTLHACIAAASVLAKVHRDRLMREYAKSYPGYGFDRNVGYGTNEHMKALDSLGPSPIHRLSFAPLSQRTIWNIAKSP